MLTQTFPSIMGVPVTFNNDEVTQLFIEQRRTRGYGRRRTFSFMRLRRVVAEKVVRTIIDHHHEGFSMKKSTAEAFYQRVEVTAFYMSRESRRHFGQYVIRVEYRVRDCLGRFRQVFHFVLDDAGVSGGLNGRLYSSRRRLYAD